MSSVNNTLTNIQNETSRIQFNRGQENLGTSDLGQDAFLQLMLVQLQNQDPLEPSDQNQMLAQQAQFTQIEKLDNLTKVISESNQLLQASSLIGKTVTIAAEDGTTSSHEVTSVQLDDKGGIAIESGNDLFLSTQIVGIQDAASSSSL